MSKDHKFKHTINMQNNEIEFQNLKNHKNENLIIPCLKPNNSYILEKYAYMVNNDEFPSLNDDTSDNLILPSIDKFPQNSEPVQTDETSQKLYMTQTINEPQEIINNEETCSFKNGIASTSKDKDPTKFFNTLKTK